MKSFSGEKTDGANLDRLVVPVGREMPRAPAIGEMFHLDVDLPEPTTPTPWFTRGTYVYNGTLWSRLNAGGPARRSAVVASREVEVPRKGNTLEVPTSVQGYDISSLIIRPSHRRATFSGVITFWMDSSVAANAWLTIFRDRKLVGLAAASVEPGRVTNMALTFEDIPATPLEVIYTAKINMDRPGSIFINQSTTLAFDGAGQTAFIVTENN